MCAETIEDAERGAWRYYGADVKRHVDRVGSWIAGHKVGVVFLIAPVAIFIGVYVSSLPSEYEGEVVDAEWKHTIIVERYQAWDLTGFRHEIPEGAFAIVSQGEKVHHHDSVHDGTRTEYYTVREACGSICSPRCRTRYCDRQRTREVSKYKQVPQYAESVAYKKWDWGEQRKVHASGHGTTDLRWPEAEAKVGEGLTHELEQERSRRESTYVVTIAFDAGRIRFEVDADAFGRYAIGTRHPVVVKTDMGETVEVDHVRVVPTRK